MANYIFDPYTKLYGKVNLEHWIQTGWCLSKLTLIFPYSPELKILTWPERGHGVTFNLAIWQHTMFLYSTMAVCLPWTSRISCEHKRFCFPVASLLNVPGQTALRVLFSRRTHLQFNYVSLLSILPIYFILACWASGSAVASGIVVPMLWVSLPIFPLYLPKALKTRDDFYFRSYIFGLNVPVVNISASRSPR